MGGVSGAFSKTMKPFLLSVLLSLTVGGGNKSNYPLSFASAQGDTSTVWWTPPAPAPSPVPPPTVPTGSNTLKIVGDELDYQLGKCEGDCDKDRDCQRGLVCFKHEVDLTFVWGCQGSHDRRTDYCMDPNDIPPTLAPTRKPTPRPTPRPTKRPTPRPTPRPTKYPTVSPTAYPTVSPTQHPTTAEPTSYPSLMPSPSPSAAPSASPSSSPSSMPSIPDKIWVPFAPFVVDLVFVRRRARRMLKTQDDNHNGPASDPEQTILHRKIDADALNAVMTTLLVGEFHLINRHFWEVLVEVDFRHEIVSEEDNTVVITYQFSGDAAFVNTTGTVLPANHELKAATTRAMNANYLLRALRESSDDPILESVQSLAVYWVDGDAMDKSKVTGIVLLVLIFVICSIVLALLYRRRRLRRERSAAFRNPAGVNFKSMRTRVAMRLGRRNDRFASLQSVSEAPPAGSRKEEEVVVNFKRSPINFIAIKSKEAWRIVRSRFGSPSSTMNNDSPNPSSAEPEESDLGLNSSSELDSSVPADIEEASSICGMSTSDWSVADVGTSALRREFSLLDTCRLPSSDQRGTGGDGSRIEVESSNGDLSALGDLHLGSVLGGEIDDEETDVSEVDDDEAPGNLKTFCKAWKKGTDERKSSAADIEDRALGVSLTDTADVMKSMVDKGDLTYLPEGLTGSNPKDSYPDLVRGQPGPPDAGIDIIDANDQSTVSGMSLCTGMQDLIVKNAATDDIIGSNFQPNRDITIVGEMSLCQDIDSDDDNEEATKPLPPLPQGIRALNSSPMAPNSTEQADDKTLMTSVTELQDAGMVRRECPVPPGRLGVVIDSTNKGTVVREVKPSSPLEGIVFPGDRIIAVNDEDTHGKSASVVTQMMAAKKKTHRKLTVLSVVTGPQ